MDRLQNRQGNRADDIVGLGPREGPGAPVARYDPGPLADAQNLLDLVAVSDVAADRLDQCPDDAIHATDGLQHGGRLVPRFEEGESVGEDAHLVDARNVADRDRLLQLAAPGAGARRGLWRGEASARRADVSHVLGERAKIAQQVVEAAVHGCRAGRELGDGAAQIGLQAGDALRLAGELAVDLDQAGAVVADERLERHAELAAIAQDAEMVMREASRAGIEVEVGSGLPVDLLGRIDLLDRVAAAQRPHAPARAHACLEDGAAIAGTAQQ